MAGAFIERNKYMKIISVYENLSKAELDEIVKFGFTKEGFKKFKKALEKAKERSCLQQK